MEINSFSEALTSVYLESPCRALPKPLWKSLLMLNNYFSNFEMENNRVVKLSLYNKDELYLYWDRNSYYIDFDRVKLCSFKRLILHETQITSRINSMFSSMESYFKLIHYLKKVEGPNLSRDYCFKKVDMPVEGEEAANMISNCQDRVKISSEDIVKWTKYSTYNEDLWIWVINKKSGKKVGLGIAEADNIIREGSIESLQILPEYRNIGLGKELVLELIGSLKNIVDFVTVSSRQYNPYDAQKLFRRCGFEGNDVWYIVNNHDKRPKDI